MALSLEQFREGLTESQTETIDKFVDDQNLPQFKSWESIVADFGRRGDTQAWRIYSRVMESFDPTCVTQDQLAMLFVWERAFAVAKVDLSAAITPADRFRASKDRDSMSDFIEQIQTFARMSHVSLPKRDNQTEADVLATAEGDETKLGDEEPF